MRGNNLAVLWVVACVAGWIGALIWFWNVLSPETFVERIVMLLLMIGGGSEILAVPFVMVGYIGVELLVEK